MRLRLHTALMTSEKPITARMWREVPLEMIEQHVMLWRRFPDLAPHFDAMVNPVEIEGLSMTALSQFFDENKPLPIGSTIPTSMVLSGEGEPEANFDLDVIRRGPGGKVTDDFLQNLAERYRWSVESGSSPAPSIAHDAGVSVATVHRWVGQARKRGFLPPAIKGKAG